MPRRIRTTKNLAKRMDLQYFKQAHPLRSWRLWLSVLVPVVAVGWFAAQRATSQKIYSSGPLSSAHAVLGKKCDVCHVTTFGFFRAKVSDDACSKCHDAPAHHADKVTYTVGCGSCHIEHRGSPRLASTQDASCTQCHANLSTRSGNAQYVRVVKDFDKQHPEFAALRPGARDPGQVKLNHYAHLRPNLAGPAGPVQMDCQDCHRLTAMDGTWPYAMPQATSQPRPVTAGMSADLKHSHSEDYILPILYVNQCAACHVKDLQFDKRFDQAAPHDKPEVVQAFLVQKYSDYFASHPRALAEAVAPERILPGTIFPNTTKLPLPVPRTRQEWMDQQVMLADRLLFDKGCKLCHVMIEGSPLPTVAKSSIPVRWFLHAEFNHDSHRLLTCTACHDRTPESRQTADILLPGIASCRSCHEDGGAQHDAASGSCSECHSYHDWTKGRPTKGKFTIPQLRAAISR
ncbi:MAG: cytochrome c3 family protein [Terriglobales bacterium]|jgi:cytochrome c7-like protein